MGADFCFLSAIETGRFYHIQKPDSPVAIVGMSVLVPIQPYCTAK